MKIQRILSSLLFGLSFWLTLMVSTPSSAGEIYKWTDEKGVVHFGDMPPADAVYSVPEIEINSYTATVPGEVGSTVNRQVVMYGTSWCSYCKKAKSYFDKNGISFREYDIEKSATARRKYNQLNGRGVPLIVVGDQRLSGFSIASFERMYNK